MTNLTILVIISIVLVYVVESQKPSCASQCDWTEDFSECGGALACQSTCKNQKLETTKCACVKGCKCRDGYVRDDYSDKCVPIEFCSRLATSNCKKNEQYSDTLAGCQKTCKTLNTPVACKRKAGCICQRGFVRRANENSACVPIEQCPDADKGKFLILCLIRIYWNDFRLK